MNANGFSVAEQTRNWNGFINFDTIPSTCQKISLKVILRPLSFVSPTINWYIYPERHRFMNFILNAWLCFPLCLIDQAKIA